MTAEARSRAAARGSAIDVELVPKRAVEALLGSTSNERLHVAERPVLVVHADD
jgi:hypothetical protein